MRPAQIPVGLQLSRTARIVGRAFGEALEQAGGSLPVWLVLLNLRIRADLNQRQLAEAVGVTEATLTHHLGAMERDGLLVRRRDPANRRNHIIELTPAAEPLFTRLAAAAQEFDRRLRGDLSSDQLGAFTQLLDRLGENLGAGEVGLPWTGLI